MTKRKWYEAKEKMLTSKPMAQMREIAFGHDTVIDLHRLEVKMAARDDAAVMAAAEAKRLRKAEKLRKQLEAQNESKNS